MGKTKRNVNYRKISRSLGQSDVTHLKFELEANFQRVHDDDYCEYCDDGSVECYECSGRGDFTCQNCDGESEIQISETEAAPCGECDDGYISCEYCDGGYTECVDCEGGGYSYGKEPYSDDDIYSDIMELLSDEAKQKIVFMRVYNDGSVDTECTFTVHKSGLKYVPEIIRAFKTVGERYGHFDIIGAGMHIAVLTDGTYRDTDKIFNPHGIDRFKNSMQPLLPALFFLGTLGAKTRSMGYRLPRIGDSLSQQSEWLRNPKYSAIHLIPNDRAEGRGICAIEFRLFEPCYDTPDRVFEYVETIAKSMQYYSNENKQVPKTTCKFDMKRVEATFQPLSDIYLSHNNARYLAQTIHELLPDGITYDDAKRARNCKLDHAHIDKVNKRRMAKVYADIENAVTNGIPPENITIRTITDTTVSFG